MPIIEEYVLILSSKTQVIITVSVITMSGMTEVSSLTFKVTLHKPGVNNDLIL